MSDTWVADLSETLRRAIGEATDELLVTAPDIETLRGLSAVEAVEWPRHVRLLTTEERVRELHREFLAATRLADLVGEDRLELRTMREERFLQPLFITSDRVTCQLLGGEERIAAVRTDDEELFHFVRGECLAMWGTAVAAELRTPRYSVILETIGERFDDPMRVDAEEMLRSAVTTRALDANLDEIHAFLLLAAKHREQYYTLSRWAERIGLASPSRFSTRKTELEDAGLLATERVETGTVGRPRQRLVLADERLRGASVDDVIGAARSVL